MLTINKPSNIFHGTYRTSCAVYVWFCVGLYERVGIGINVRIDASLCHKQDTTYKSVTAVTVIKWLTCKQLSRNKMEHLEINNYTHIVNETS